MPRWVLLLDGIAGVIIAAITLVAPDVTALALLYMIAVWCLITGSLLIGGAASGARSEEHTSELQSLMRISYAVFCLKKKTKHNNTHTYTIDMTFNDHHE